MSAEARLRADARAMVEAGLAAADPRPAVARALAASPLRPPSGGSLRVVAVGKAARAMLAGAREVLPDGVEAILLEPAREGGREDGAPAAGPTRLFRGGHPLPDAAGVAGARAVEAWMREAGARDRVLLLLSGGGSALLSLPAPGVSLEDLRAVTDLLLRAGAPIHELNAVRKHLETLKGGGLARLAHPARVRVLAVSDVVGDRLDVIASGPAAPDPSTWEEAWEVLGIRGVRDAVPAGVRARLEAGLRGEIPDTPGPGAPALDGVEVEVVLGVGDAVRGAAGEARRRGYDTREGPLDVTGEAREVGRKLGRSVGALEPGRPMAWIRGGETTVTVRGGGAGGPNQEVALGAVAPLDGHPSALVASVGTDGIDGPTDAAGARATGTTGERARRAGLDPDAALVANDAYPFFRELGDLVTTGPTGTNVMDLQVALVR